MYLIDNTYFVNKLQLDGVLNSNNGVAEKLESYIETYVIELLQALFGYTDFEDLNSNITDGALDNTAPQKWKDLINGKEYVKDGKTYFWRGLIYQNGNVKRSILANYVFCQIMADLQTNNGTAVIDSKNAVKSVPRGHYVSVWNELAMEMKENCTYQPVRTVVNGVVFTDYFQPNNNTYVTLATYLNDNKTDFAELTIPDLKILNSFDLQ